MKKIKVELTPEELASLMHIVGEKEKEIQSQSLHKNLSLGLNDKLVANLTNTQKEQTIKVQVKAAIFRLTGIPANQINDTDNLTKDLHMTSVQIRSLSIPFTHIARQYKAGATINSDECEQQETVQDCVDLIIGKTN